MSCQRCKSTRVADISTKCSDRCNVVIGNYNKSDYSPSDMGVGGGDYVRFRWCLECGQIQGEWPLEKSEAERFDPKACEVCGETDYFNEIGECGNCGHQRKMWCPKCDNKTTFSKIAGGRGAVRCNTNGHRCMVTIEELEKYNEEL